MPKITCNRCGIPQDPSQYYVRGTKGGPRGGEPYKRCRTCSAKHGRDFYAANRDEVKKRSMVRAHAIRMRNRALIELAKEGRSCDDCGKQYPSCAMEFHHLDPSTKTATISVLSASRVTTRTEPILEELKLCGLLCAICHRIRTRGAKPRAEVQALLDDPIIRAELTLLLTSSGALDNGGLNVL
jgi:hypothetical protein